MQGKVQTVLGHIEPERVGCTLTHEHLIHDLNKRVFKKPLPSSIKSLGNLPFKLENLCWIHQYPYCFEENLEFGDESVCQAVKDEIKFFKENGGGTIVENSSWGLRAKSQHLFLKELSAESGVNIVAGTGFYVADSLSLDTLSLPKEEIQSIISKELLEGIDGTDIKCGVIGEIGCSWPLHLFEKHVLQAAAAIQEDIHCPVIIHPGRHKEAPEEIIRIFQEAGGRVAQTVMSHLDRTIVEEEALAEFASLGCYCEFDLFGIEVSHYQHNEEVDMPSDAQRIARLLYLIEQGFAERIVISHDIHTKHRLMKFGGHGYSHILINIVPKMQRRGITKENIENFLIHNPKHWLTFQ